MPPPDRQNIDVPFSGGLRQKTAEQWLDPSAQVIATNAIWIVQNGIEKRPGWTRGGNTSNGVTYPLSSSGFSFGWGGASLKSGVSLIPSRASFALSDGWYIYAISEDSSINEWQDFVPPCVATRRPVAASPQSVFNPTVASFGGVDLYVWQDTSAFGGFADVLYFALVDEASGRIIRSGPIDPSGATTGRAPKIIISAGLALVFYEVSAAVISYVSLDLTSATAAWNASSIFASGGSYSGGGFDVCETSLNTSGPSNNFAIVHTTTGGLRVYHCTRALSSVTITASTVTALTVPNGNGIGCAIFWNPSASVTWVASSYISAGSANVIVAWLLHASNGGFPFTVTTTFGPTALVSYASSSNETVTRQVTVVDMTANSNTRAGVIWEVSGGTPIQTSVGWAALTGSGSASLNRQLAWQTQLLSRAFAVNTPDTGPGDRCYAVVGTVEPQETQILAEFDLSGFAVVPHPVASIAPRLVTAASPSGVFTGQARDKYSVSGITGYTLRAPASVRYAGILSETSNVPSDFSLISGAFDFLNGARAKGVRLGSLAYLAGGLNTTFDGVNVVEASTPAQMVTPTCSSTTTGGNLTNGQTYSYIWLPEYRDVAGNVHYGQPSAPVAVAIGSTGTTGKVTGTVPCLSLTTKGCLNRRTVMGQSAMYLVPYRTVFINGAMSTNYFRLVGDDPGAAYVNTPDTGPTIAFTDTASDASIQTNSLLPTTGGVLEADCPSSFADICVHNSRVYGIGDDLRTIWISTAQQDGVPCTFNDGAQFQVPFLGDLTAIWSMDSNLFIASATGIAYVSGDGPNITGAQSNLSPPTQVPSDIGCTNPLAVCVTPIGTVFRTAYGLALLDRSLSMHSDFGDPITTYLESDAFPNVTSIQLHPTRPEILVFAYTVFGNVNVGAVFSFNYRFSAWSAWLISDPDTTYAAAGSAIVSGGNIYQFTTPGRLFRECVQSDTQPYYDEANAAFMWIPLMVTSAWIKPGGDLQSTGWVHQYQPTWIAQDWSDLIFGIAYDYNPTVQQTTVFGSAAASTFAAVGLPTNVSIHPMPSRCTAMQISISDQQPAAAPAATTGQGPRILGLSCEVEAAGGLKRLQGSQKG